MQIDLISILSTTVFLFATASVAGATLLALGRPRPLGLTMMPIPCAQRGAAADLLCEQEQQLTNTRKTVSSQGLDWFPRSGANPLLQEWEIS